MGGGTVAVKQCVGSYGASPHTVSSIAVSAFTGMYTIGKVMPEIPEEPSMDENETEMETESDGEYEGGIAIDMDL